MLEIGSLAVDPPLVLAPMAGVTDRDFRLIVRRIGGVGLVTMEFIQAKGLVGGDRRVLRLLHYEEEERPISIQIYGSDPDTMAEAARIVEEIGADACDVNMGCPANKVLKGCAGAALMADLKLAERIVDRVRKAITIPLTVKFRLGVDDGRRNFLELGRICQDRGADAVALHARTARQMFRGRAEWSEIARLKEALDLPVLGNGDVRSAADALRMMRVTGCDGVMIGRGATRNPWIFRQIAAALSHGAVPQPTLDDRRRLIVAHFRTVLERDEPKLALHKLRTFTNWYSRGLPDGLSLRRQLAPARSAEEVLRAVEAHFDALELEEVAA
ncbi:MAG: tRNA dihydrouridine synthase DusB [Acidobacteria bacterium]|nr:MAG: tRNA dihydrouridine synthase DusB [Acidobacteriota bacterium]